MSDVVLAHKDGGFHDCEVREELFLVISWVRLHSSLFGILSLL